jgi:hypothetical protein
MATASICIYGTRRVGFYCLADSGGRMFGTMPELGGEFVGSATVAIWNACQEMMAAGVPADARVSVHMDTADGLPLVAFVERLDMMPSFGSLEFSTCAPALVISADEIVAAVRA